MTGDKPDLSKYMPKDWQGVLPPCQIQVSPEGELMHNGAPLVHPRILDDIFNSVHLEDGHYILRMDGQACELEVADTFWVVKSVDRSPGGLELTLNHGGKEPLATETLWQGGQDMIYCLVKDGEFPARFGRQAYYQLAQFIEPHDQGFALVLGESRQIIVKKS